MPTTEGYNGAYTGQQIDEAIAKANVALPAPDGGTTGQVLTKTADGAEWVDKPVMYVNITESGGTYSADKTAAEIYDAVQSGYAVFARVEQDAVLWLYASSSDSSMFVAQVGSSAISLNLFDTDGETVCALSSYVLSGSNIRFTPASGLTSTNVQDAIEELAGKFPKPASATLAASGWSSNTQTITVSGVKTSGQNVRLSPVTKADADAWASAGCWCTAQAENALTFTCDTVPAQDIQLNVEMQEVQS